MKRKLVSLFTIVVTLFIVGCGTTVGHAPVVIGQTPNSIGLAPTMPWDPGFAQSTEGRNVGQIPELDLFVVKAGIFADTLTFENKHPDCWVRLGDETKTYAWVGPQRIHRVMLSRIPQSGDEVRIIGEVYEWENRKPVFSFKSRPFHITQPRRGGNGRIIRGHNPRFENYGMTLYPREYEREFYINYN